jgi:hypothetical protein
MISFTLYVLSASNLAPYSTCLSPHSCLTDRITVQQDPDSVIEAAMLFDRSHAFADHSQETSGPDLYSSYWIHLESVVLNLLDCCPDELLLFQTPPVQRLCKLCGQNLVLFECADDCKNDCTNDLNALLSALSTAQHYLQLHVLLHPCGS